MAALYETTPFIRRTALDAENAPEETRLPGRADRRRGLDSSPQTPVVLSGARSPARHAANALLATVSFTAVANGVFEALRALDLDDLDAGPRAGGYVEPSEAAWVAIENVMAPYFHDLERRVQLKHQDEATALCKGIVLGLYRAEHRGFELLEYAEDGPSEFAGQAVVIWQRRRRTCSLPRMFVEKFTPDWDWLVR